MSKKKKTFDCRNTCHTDARGISIHCFGSGQLFG